jgi:hypothetical protein
MTTSLWKQMAMFKRALPTRPMATQPSSMVGSDTCFSQSRPEVYNVSRKRSANKIRPRSGMPVHFGKFRRHFHSTDHANFTEYRLSANMAVATLNVGTLGPSVGLSFWHSFAIILLVNIFSCLLPAWTASFGLTGLRMTSFS